MPLFNDLKTPTPQAERDKIIEVIGSIEDFLFDDQSSVIRYAVVDTGEWLPGRKVLLAPAWIERLSWGDRTVVAALDRGTIESAPDYEPDKPITRDYEIELYKHYGSQQYWD